MDVQKMEPFLTPAVLHGGLTGNFQMGAGKENGNHYLGAI